MNKTVLIIDDDKELCKTVAFGLRKNGFNVITCFSGEEGEKFLHRIQVDAIVLDRMMTGIDGLTFLKNIRKNNILTPVIMLTAMSGSENVIAGLSNGADDYLAKPFQLQELILRLNNIIQRNTKIYSEINELQDIDGCFFITDPKTKRNKLFALSQEEYKLLKSLTSPIGSIVASSPMIAKRLRNKLNVVLSNLDILTIRGQGYKLTKIKSDEKQ